MEADQDADVVALTAELTDALTRAGIDSPIVEVRRIGDAPTTLEAVVTELGVPVWSRFAEVELQIAPVYDHADDGVGGFDADHGIIDGDERARLVAYLDAGTTVLTIHTSADDIVDPDGAQRVPIDLVTDGHWVWSRATGYYLDAHGLAPPEPFLSHLRARPRLPTSVDSATQQRAFDLTTGGEPAESDEPVPADDHPDGD